jgi:hypothetical protein
MPPGVMVLSGEAAVRASSMQQRAHSMSCCVMRPILPAWAHSVRVHLLLATARAASVSCADGRQLSSGTFSLDFVHPFNESDLNVVMRVSDLQDCEHRLSVCSFAVVHLCTQSDSFFVAFARSFLPPRSDIPSLYDSMTATVNESLRNAMQKSNGSLPMPVSPFEFNVWPRACQD